MRKLFTALAVSGFLATALVPTTTLADMKTTPLLKTELEGMAGTEANILLFEVDPGFKTDRHTHPGHVFVYVLEGTIVIDAEGEEPKTVSAGEAAYEVFGKPMIGRNASSSEGARFVVFQVGPAGEPIMVPHKQ